MSTAKHISRLWPKLVAAGAGCLLSFTLTHCAEHPEEPSAPEPPGSPATEALVLGMRCVDGQLSSGAPYEVCVNRSLWNGDLVVFVPGYTNPAATPTTPTGDILGLSAADAVTSLGYAWATTGFRETGLVVPRTWIDEDLLTLVKKAKGFLRDPVGRTYLTGGSQGGLIATLGVEQYPQVFTGGGLAACGPTGSYQKQLDYVGDFRVIFDFNFDPVITGLDWPVWTQSPPTYGAVDPTSWTAAIQNAAAKAVQTYPNLTADLLSVTKAPIDAANPGPTTLVTVHDLLRYTFIGTNDAMAKLGGLPYGNTGRLYAGSSNDAALNAGVERFTFTASNAAVNELETTGQLSRPLVTIYTTGDHIVPVWHESLYRNKTASSFSSWLLYSGIKVSRYGHCTFTPEEVLGAFALLVLKASGQNLVLTQQALPEPHSRAEFLRAAREFGASPRVIEK